MTLNIGATIAQLRKEHNFTQEALADAVGVSAAAVSKWETGQSYPDIALLPRLARFFATSVDALLSYEPAITEEQRGELLEKADAVFSESGWAEGLAFCHQLLREYPTDMLLRIYLASGLMQNLVFAPDDEARQYGRDLQIQWLQEASAATDGHTQLMAKNLLGTFYIYAKRLDEAETILTPLLDTPNPQNLLPTLYLLKEQYDKATKHGQIELFGAVHSATLALGTLSSISIREKRFDDAVRYIDAIEGLSEQFGIENLHRINIVTSRMSLASATQNNQALLDAAVAYADAAMHQDSAIQSPFFEALARENSVEHDARDKAVLELLIKEYEANEAYDAIRNEPRFQSAIEALKKGAE